MLADDYGREPEMNTDLDQRAEHHVQEAERLLAGRLGLLTSYVKAQVHATLAVYYCTEAQRLASKPQGSTEPS